MVEVQLPRGVWRYDDNRPLGAPGGFGAVFDGLDANGAPVAVKRLHVGAAAAAHREMGIAEHLVGKQFKHVLPVLDAGLDPDSDSYFVVMPRAERSLQDEIRQGPLDDLQAAGVLLQIAKGMAEIPQIVHRDLKPSNILFHDAVWKIADFGIARFVEESTSIRTLKGCLSPAYAAPEQWRGERATSATDVYALGCVGYAVLTGQPPFTADNESLSRQHQTAEPPPLEGHLPRLRSIISLMLRKLPQTRPSIDRIMSILDAIGANSVDAGLGEGIKALASAGAAVAEAESAREARRAQERQRLAERRELVCQAHRILMSIKKHLDSQVRELAPTATVADHGIHLGGASFEMHVFDEVIAADAFPQSKWDVVTGATIMVTQHSPRYVASALLLYANTDRRTGHRWYELAFVSHPLTDRRRPFEPFALAEDELRDADKALGPGAHAIQLKSLPVPIDDEHEAVFLDRWAGILAKAAQGQLP